MKLKTTLVLLAAFAALLAVVLLFESKDRKAAAVKEKEGKLVDVASADVRKIEIKREDGTIALEKDAQGAWRLTAPLQAGADATEVEGLLSALSSLRFERVVEANAGDLKAYGIPGREISLWLKDGRAPLRILIGMENPLDQSFFAKRDGDPRLVLLASSLKSALEKKLIDLRDKDIFKFEAAGVKSVRVKAKDLSWEAVREGDGWLLQSPVRALADRIKVESLLDSISAIKAKEFLSEDKSAADVKRLGLDKPACEVTLSMTAAGKTLVFSLGKVGDKSCAMNSESGKIVAFEGSLLADLEKKPDELRDKKVASFSSWEADKVFVKKGAFELAALREKVNDQDGWFLDTAAKDAADAAKVEAFIRRIEGLEAAAFIDNPTGLSAYGLDRPGAEIRVRTKGADGKPVETALLLGTEDTEKKQVVVKNAKLDYLFRVDASFLQDFPKDAKDWKTAPVPASDAKK